ncbi:hypothetical protein [Agromyces aerolatus]|uniref:hypothetical protein n=1 Tax=Agromyces sp. LY-1074 TaxID=3074080 RepID=UPI00285858D4|nr:MULTISPECIES: hypothetical protein [unclassified Agromyces]MDR5699656.1 hypothetical protein [Agromyces sp. LY-1074]MDR5705952.1 hypothetical protein [Agromyces sp. LY-1358]
MRTSVLKIGLTFGLAAAAATATTSAAAAPDDPIPATADAYDTYSEEIFRSFIGRVDGEQWSGMCKRGYWLDSREGSPGLSVGKGFIVQMQAAVPVVVLEHPLKRLFAGGYVAGSGGDATNLDPFYTRFVSITMVCTNDPAYAWAG